MTDLRLINALEDLNRETHKLRYGALIHDMYQIKPEDDAVTIVESITANLRAIIGIQNTNMDQQATELLRLRHLEDDVDAVRRIIGFNVVKIS